MTASRMLDHLAKFALFKSLVAQALPTLRSNRSSTTLSGDETNSHPLLVLPMTNQFTTNFDTEEIGEKYILNLAIFFSIVRSCVC